MRLAMIMALSTVAAVFALAAESKPGVAVEPSALLATDLLERLDEELDLAPAQHEKLAALLAASRPPLAAQWAKIVGLRAELGKLEAEFDSGRGALRAGISRELNRSQRRRFKRWAGRKPRWRPRKGKIGIDMNEE